MRNSNNLSLNIQGARLDGDITLIELSKFTVHTEEAPYHPLKILVSALGVIVEPNNWFQVADGIPFSDCMQMLVADKEDVERGGAPAQLPENSLLQMNGENQIKLYPNPVSEQLTIVLNGVLQEEEVQFELFDIRGTIIQTNQFKASVQQEISIHSIPKGVYIYRLSQSGTLLKQGKIIKQ